MKTSIKNRKDEPIVVLIEESEKSRGLAFLMHGMGCNKKEPIISIAAKSFKQNNYTVVRFDTTNAFEGESYGKYENATITNYYEDLEDVIKWTSTNNWYKEPFILAGHSVGGLCVTLFAEKFPSKVKALSLISTMISGKLSQEYYPPEILKKWENEGILEWKENGKLKRLKWNCVEDGLKYDALENIELLKMPILIITGENDLFSPTKHQKILYDSITGEKDLKIIKQAQHLFTEKTHLDEIKNLFNNWIASLDLSKKN